MIKNLFNVENLSVLISGGSRGIGLQLAEGFLINGAKVSILSENKKELELALKEYRTRFPGKIFGIVCDVRSFKACQKAVKQAVSEMGTLTTTICNAGVVRSMPIESYQESDWK